MADGLPTSQNDWPGQQQFNREVDTLLATLATSIATLTSTLATATADLATLTSSISDLSDAIDACCS